MTEAIAISLVTALVAGLCTAIPAIYATKSENKTTRELTGYRIDQLEKKVDKHNGFEAKINDLKEENSVLKEKMAVANHRIDDLERRTA